MKAKAVRLHGAGDLRLDEFELPEIGDDEILVKVISDSVCMSTYKCAVLGEKHKRVHDDVAEHPAIMGHEFAGEIVQVGKNHQEIMKNHHRYLQELHSSTDQSYLAEQEMRRAQYLVPLENIQF